MNIRTTIVAAVIAVTFPMLAAPPANADTDCPPDIDDFCFLPLTPAGDPYQSDQTQVPGGPWTSTILEDAPTAAQAGLYPGDDTVAAITSDDTDPWDITKLATNCKWEGEVAIDYGLVPDGLRILGPVITVDYVKVRTRTEIVYKYCWRQISSTTRHTWYDPRWLDFRFTSDQNDATGHLQRFRCGQVGIGGFDHFLVNGNMWDDNTTINPDPFHVPCVRGSTGNSVAKPINPSRKKLRYTGDFPGWTVKSQVINVHYKDYVWAIDNGVINPNS